ncbi:hypothetical protein O1M54_19075 [Streptomyces diastatochromogenes]|nr:hypothetical protein [Streptomyces diastatochromogenes]
MPAQGPPGGALGCRPQSAAGGAAPRSHPGGSLDRRPQSAAGGIAPHRPAQRHRPRLPWAASADSGRAQSSPWAAQLGRSRSGSPAGFGGLWRAARLEPLPPGETLVRRPGSTA